MRSALSSCAARHAFAIAAATLTLCVANQVGAATLQWAGRTWSVTSGGMAGVAQGSPSNVSVDNDGYLHLKITKSGNSWTAAELFTTDKLGFGTYQWQVDGPIDRFDKNVVLGLYPYGPAAGIGKDGTNEIDIEYSFWGNANGVNGDWTDYPASGTVIGEKSYKFSLNGGNVSTSRFIWSTSKIENFLLQDMQPVGSTTGLINSWTYAPNNPTINIPQQALPLGMNLWCFGNPPSDGKDVEVVIRNFQFVPEGTSPSGGGGTGGAGTGGTGAAGRGGSSSSGSTGGGGGGNGGGGNGGASSGGSPARGGAANGAAGASTSGASGASNAEAGAPASGSSGTSTSASGASASQAGAAGSNASSGASALSAGSGVALDTPGGEQSAGCSLSSGLPRPEVTWLSLLPLLALGARRRRRAG